MEGIPNAAHGMAEVVHEEIGVRPGDAVRLGPPPDLPASVFAMGLVTAPNVVTIRLFNTSASSITAQETLSTWTVFVGNGPDAGHPQPL